LVSGLAKDADILGRHLGRDLVGDQPYILGSLDQIYDCQIVPDEVREIIKDENRPN
jgi:hypothetical protein